MDMGTDNKVIQEKEKQKDYLIKYMPTLQVTSQDFKQHCNKTKPSP